MPAWAAQREVFRRQLSRTEVDRIGSAIGMRVVESRHLRGGLATATYALRCADGSRLVLKRYAPDDTTAIQEWERLHFAVRTAVPTPVPVALGHCGEWFDSHGLVMTALPGRPWFDGGERWLQHLAAAAAAIHATDVSGATGALVRPHTSTTWTPPRRQRPTHRTRRIVQAIERRLPHVDVRPTTVLHGDLHPGNLLWQRGHLSGVADWSAAPLGPRAFEVAYTRADLAVVLGVGAAERYGQIYASLTGADLSDLPLWDLVCGLQAMAWHHRWLVAYAEQGQVIPPSTARDRLARWTDAALRAASCPE